MKIKILVLLALLQSTFSVSVIAQTEIKSLIEKSAEYEQQNKLEVAAGELTKAIAIQPDNADLYLRRADLYRFLEKNDLLAADAKKSAALSPDNQQIILAAARLLRNSQKCSESLNILDAYISKNPESDEAFSARAHGSMCLGNWLSAYQDVSQASRLKPDNNLYRTTQAGLLARLGNDVSAGEQLDQLIKALEGKLATAPEGSKENLKRDLARIYQTRAGINHAKSDSNAEFADLAKFIEYSPSEFSRRQRAKIYWDHQMYVEAIADYTEAIRLSPTNSIFLLERGDVYAEAKKYDEALQDYAQSLKLEPALKEAVDQRVSAVRMRKK